MAKPSDKTSTVRARASATEVQSEWIAPRELEALIDVMERREVAELEIVRGTGVTRRRLTIRRGRVAAASVAHSGPTTTAHVGAQAPAASAPTPKVAPTEPESEVGVTYVTSPLVGTFYRSPNPDSAPFVDVGTKIRPGQRLCIVEAMKLMNEIEAEIDGTVVEILAENGKPVEYGQKLFKVRK